MSRDCWTSAPRNWPARSPRPDRSAGRQRFEHFLEKAVASPEVLARLESDPRLAESVFDIFEHSNWFADELLRHPELLDEIGEPVHLEGEWLDDGIVLRRFYRRQMLRIQCESILQAAPIFETLDKTSTLADIVIAAAYDIAVREAPRPADPSYSPGNQMMVIALGRLGMREFDLGSDADLVFVIPDQGRRRAGLLDAGRRARSCRPSAPTPAKA